MKIRPAMIGFILGLTVFLTQEAGSETITYQARIKNSTGADLSGPVTVGFRVYSALTGATVLWGETQTVAATRGIISVELGKVTPLPAGLFNNPELYLGLTVAGDAEMSPRTRLLSTWKAVSAVKSSGKQVQAGGGVLNVSEAATASIPIIFPHAFSSVPVVMLGALSNDIGGTSFIPVRVTEITTNGCTAHFAAIGGTTAAGSATFDWIAVGE